MSEQGKTENKDADIEPCECISEVVPGAIWPMATNGDDSLMFVERCDACERFSSDDEAAEAVAAQIQSRVFWARVDGVTSRQPFVPKLEQLRHLDLYEEDLARPQSPALADRFVREVAALTQDGEEVDGEDFVMENDDAVGTLNSLIGQARELLSATKASGDTTPKTDASEADTETPVQRWSLTLPQFPRRKRS
jgi:hypothetical protein